MSKWDGRFLALAAHVSQWSKDPSTKVGAVIVDPDRRIISIGFNGFPKGMPDRNEWYDDRDFKYAHIVHAEENAILFADREKLKGATLYTWPFMPCSRCAAKIAQVGIIRVVAPHSDNPRWREDFARSRTIFAHTGVVLEVT